MAGKTQNDLLLRVLAGETVKRPPVWLMRQAGRILPEYRAVRASVSGFVELATTPALAAEVTVQPVDILGVDVAILFSDILVVPEAMGLPYQMVESRGPVFPKTISTDPDVVALRSGAEAAAHLQYVYDAITLTKQKLDNRVPVIGFAGAPWTLLAYMVEGKGSKSFDAARAFLYQKPATAHRLLEKITETTIAYLATQITYGVNLVQVFDSWAGMLSPAQYAEFGAPYMKQIADALAPFPVTLFAKGAAWSIEDLAQSPCRVVGLDWQTDPHTVRGLVGDKVLQGNFDPAALFADPQWVYEHARRMCQQFGPGHIANLGHGVAPTTPLDGVRAFIEGVKSYRYEHQVVS
jgi:uroporphyrinogen decarboxylase